MTQEQNKALVRKLWADLSRGSVDGFLASLADDVRFTMMGSTKYSVVCNGKDEFVSKLVRPLTAQLEGLQIVPDQVFADGEYVITPSRGHARTKSGEPYDQHYCQVIRVADGKIKEIVEYLDTALVAQRLK
jgi:ketosteroid isomerase-like protein